MKSGNIDVPVLVKKLEEVLDFLDECDLAIPAIKIEEAINALKQEALDKSESTKQEL